MVPRVGAWLPRRDTVVNYYERHIGDYAKNAAHLSLLEHGVYVRLIDVYYTRESPIPDDKAARLIGAATPETLQALQVVLEEFFVRDGDVWRQPSCDAEIAEYVSGEPQREAKKVNELTRLQRHREERANLFKALNGAGLHADWNIKIGELRKMVQDIPGRKTATGHQPLPATAPATPATATHSPLPTTQSPPLKRDISTLRVSSPEGDQLALDDPALAKPIKPPKVPNCPYDLVFAAYHEQLPELPKVRMMDDPGRRASILKLWKWVFTSVKSDRTPRATNAEEGIAWVRGYFGHAAQNDFVMGRTSRGPGHENWQADIDYLLSRSGMKQVIEKTRTT